MTQAIDSGALRPLDAGKFAARAEDSTTLPSDWYHDPEIYRLEHEAIFYRTWWYQCHVSDLPEPGDFHAGEVADQGIFIIRGGDDQLRAFYNVCSHRAHPLVEGSGNKRLIVCPYHQWRYRPDGRFHGARGREAPSDCPVADADLKPVRVENFGGLLFVNLDSQAQPLAEQAGDFLADMRRCCPRLDDLVRVERYEFDVAANWKTVIDNNHECYHCAANHKTLMELVAYDGKARWSDSGITFSHAVDRRRFDNGAYALEAAKVEQEPLFGYIWPATIPLFFPGSASLCLFQVLPTGPETTRERWDFYFVSEALDAQERGLVDYIRTCLTQEDVGLCERVQKGLHSRGYRQGRFIVDRTQSHYSEHHVHFFQKMVHDALTAPATA